MLESVSPYALLRASIPKAASQPAGAYDLFSVAQSSAQDAPAREAAPALRETAMPQADAGPAAAPDPRAVPEPQAAPEPPVAPRMRASTLPARRTHYVSDIAARHNAAARSATFSAAPGARRNPPLQPPVQRPET